MKCLRGLAENNKGMEEKRKKKEKKHRVCWESNGIHVAVWNMCSGCTLIRRSSTSPRRSVYVVRLPGGGSRFLFFSQFFFCCCFIFFSASI